MAPHKLSYVDFSIPNFTLTNGRVWIWGIPEYDNVGSFVIKTALYGHFLRDSDSDLSV